MPEADYDHADPGPIRAAVADPQYGYRDSADPWTTSLSNAVEFVIAP